MGEWFAYLMRAAYGCAHTWKHVNAHLPPQLCCPSWSQVEQQNLESMATCQVFGRNIEELVCAVRRGYTKAHTCGLCIPTTNWHRRMACTPSKMNDLWHILARVPETLYTRTYDGTADRMYSWTSRRLVKRPLGHCWNSTLGYKSEQNQGRSTTVHIDHRRDGITFPITQHQRANSVEEVDSHHSGSDSFIGAPWRCLCFYSVWRGITALPQPLLPKKRVRVATRATTSFLQLLSKEPPPLVGSDGCLLSSASFSLR